MAQRNYVQPQGSGQAPRPPQPLDELQDIPTKNYSVDVEFDKSDLNAGIKVDTPLYFIDLRFTGLNPSDEGGSSLFRRWIGRYEGLRSDGERFYAELSMLQNDTPYNYGPAFEAGLQALMTYSRCGCRPSGKVVCGAHAVEGA